MRLLSNLFIVFFITISTNSWAQKSDHIIYDSFGDWSVRHVFDQKTLTYKYSDAKTPLLMTNGKRVGFQINRRAGDNETTYIIQGWLDKVIIRVDQKEFINTQSSMHTFYGDAGIELLNAISNTTQPVEIKVFVGNKGNKGTLSPKGSGAALRWIRVIN